MADMTCSFHSVKLFLASFSDNGHPISDPIREKAAGCPEEVAMDKSIKKRPSSDTMREWLNVTPSQAHGFMLI
jgi:hypothetical protein